MKINWLDRRNGIAAIVFIFYVYMRLEQFAPRPLWLDELEHLRGLGLPLRALLMNYLPSVPGGAPGDYLLTYPLAQVSHNKWVLAIPHFLCMIGLYVLFVKLLKERVISPVIFLFTLVALSINETLSYHALE